jgi:Winged helix DNA-binding domain
MRGRIADVTVLDRRALNRALLARQHLLRRAELPVPAAVEGLVGLQAQAPDPPYVGLWTRLAGFRQDDLARLFETREVVRIALWRGTIHLVTARDCQALRPLVRPVMRRAFAATPFGRDLAGVDLAALATAGRALVEERPRTFQELGRDLSVRWPDRDPAALAQAIRAYVPLVQVPPRGIWGASGPAAHTSAESWLGTPLEPDPSPDRALLRYLAAFGPATVRDAQKWSGLTRLAEVARRLRPGLVTFRDEAGAELFDLPDAPRPDPDTPAPPRFLPEYDNVWLSHDDRTRVLPPGSGKPWDAYVKGDFFGPLLVDGFYRATWSVDDGELTIHGFAAAPSDPAGTSDEIEREAASLVAFLSRSS